MDENSNINFSEITSKINEEIEKLAKENEPQNDKYFKILKDSERAKELVDKVGCQIKKRGIEKEEKISIGKVTEEALEAAKKTYENEKGKSIKSMRITGRRSSEGVLNTLGPRIVEGQSLVDEKTKQGDVKEL